MALIGFSVALIGVSAARAVFWTVPTRFLTGVAAAGGLAFINSIGTVGGFVGPSMMGWLREFSGSYVFGLAAVAAIMVAATARIAVAETLHTRANKSLREQQPIESDLHVQIARATLSGRLIRYVAIRFPEFDGKTKKYRKPFAFL